VQWITEVGGEMGPVQSTAPAANRWVNAPHTASPVWGSLGLQNLQVVFVQIWEGINSYDIRHLCDPHHSSVCPEPLDFEAQAWGLVVATVISVDMFGFLFVCLFFLWTC
jgi:hypothetical protein